MKHIKLSTSYKISNDESMAGGVGRIYNTDGKHEESHNMIVKSGRQMIISSMFTVISNSDDVKIFFSSNNDVTTPAMTASYDSETETLTILDATNNEYPKDDTRSVIVSLNKYTLSQYNDLDHSVQESGNYIYIDDANCLLHIHAWVHKQNSNNETDQATDLSIKVGSAGLLVNNQLFSRMTFRPYSINYGDDTCFDYDIYF